MNLARIQSFSHHSGNQAAVESLLEETSCSLSGQGEIDIDSAAFVGDDANSTGAPAAHGKSLWADAAQRIQMADQAQVWSKRC